LEVPRTTRVLRAVKTVETRRKSDAIGAHFSADRIENFLMERREGPLEVPGWSLPDNKPAMETAQ
jgi:hypothetical protein